ncbi:MAG: transcriptional repressor [Eubacteriales bacterium]
MDVQRKRSKKRDAILECLRSTKTHPTAEWIYQQLKPQIPNLSLGTVYRNLSLFRQEGTIVCLGTVNGLERFDGCTHPHVHFICQCCGAVHDVDDLEVPHQLKEQVSKSIGGHVSSCVLSFTGECDACHHPS